MTTETNVVHGTPGPDAPLRGTAGKDEMHGYGGDDWILGYGGDDTLKGGAGKDTLGGGAGADRLYGGAGGNDRASYGGAAAGVVADLFNVAPGETQEDGYLPEAGFVQHTNTGDAAGDLYHGIESLGGSRHDDELYGNDVANILLGGDSTDKLYGRGGNDKLYGQNGDDWLYGGKGRDSLYGGAGVDTLKGGDGDDWIVGDDWSDDVGGADKLYGGAGKDTLWGGAGADWLYGGEGDNDYASYRHAPEGVVADLFNVAPGETQEDGYLPEAGFVQHTNTGDAAGDLYHGIESLWGSGHDDELYGNDVKNILLGDDGDDKLYGRGGNDKLYGQDGEDTLEGGAGRDSLYGGDDRDTLKGGAGDDWIVGGDGDDRLLDGGADKDTLYGGAGADILRLGGGSDTVIFGRGDGHDTVEADGFDADSTDKVRFGSGVKTEDLWFEESGDDLKISVVGEEDSLTLKDWFKASPAGRMDEFHLSEGERLVESRVQSLVDAMAGWSRTHGAGPAGLGDLPNDEAAYRSFTSALDTAWQSSTSG